jgi:hypothetical protein
MRWIYRVVVLALLTGSMLLNGLQYVGGAFINGVYTLVEGITDIASASMLQKRKIASLDEMRVAQQGKLKTLESVVDKQKRELGALTQKTVTQEGKLKTLQSVVDKNRVESALASQKRVAQRAKLSGLQSKVKTVIGRIRNRGALRVGLEAFLHLPGVPQIKAIPGLAEWGGYTLIAAEAGFVYADISDQCELLEDLNLWVKILDFEPQIAPVYCNYTPANLAREFPSGAEFAASMKQTSFSNIMGDYGKDMHDLIKRWGEDDATLDDSRPASGFGERVDSLNEKVSDSWRSLRNSTKSFGQRAKGKWADLLESD